MKAEIEPHGWDIDEVTDSRITLRHPDKQADTLHVARLYRRRYFDFYIATYERWGVLAVKSDTEGALLETVETTHSSRAEAVAELNAYLADNPASA